MGFNSAFKGLTLVRFLVLLWESLEGKFTEYCDVRVVCSDKDGNVIRRDRGGSYAEKRNKERN